MNILKAKRTIIFFIISLALILVSLFCMTLILIRLRRFEKDVDDEVDKIQNSPSDDMRYNVAVLKVLNKREKID